MSKASLIRSAVAAAVTLAGLAVSTAAQAAMVSYDFSADIDSLRGNSSSLTQAGIPLDGALTGSFSYDSSGGWSIGSTTIIASNGGGLTFTVDQVDVDAGGVVLVANARTDQMQVATTDGQVWVNLYLPNQTVENGSLPTTLSLQPGATLTVGTGLPLLGSSVSAHLRSLTASGTALSVPELDPASGAASLALLAGGLALLVSRRREASVESIAA